MTIAIQTQFVVRQSTIEMEGQEIRCGMQTGVEWVGFKHAQVNIPCVTLEALLGRYHPCVDGIGDWLLCVLFKT